MFFDGFADLTDSFNTAIIAGAQTAALGVTTAALFSLTDDKKNKEDDLAPLKAVAKMSLMGMIL